MVLDTSAAVSPGRPSTFHARFSGAVCARMPSQVGGFSTPVLGSVAETEAKPLLHWFDWSGAGGWSMAATPNVVRLVKLIVTQSPSWARSTSGWIGSLPSPMDTWPDCSSWRTAEMFWSRTYINELGSCTPNRFSVMFTLIADTLNVSCGAFAHEPLPDVVVVDDDVRALGLAYATPLAGPPNA